jgi:hypothetical protein
MGYGFLCAVGTAAASGKGTMNAKNALGFLALGALMGLLPRFFPGCFPIDGVDGSSGREIWMESMGFIQAALGSCYLAKHYAVLPMLRWNATRSAAEKPVPVMLPGTSGALK